jgi:4-hydroxy-tetrahydrodipicolinate synthase
MAMTWPRLWTALATPFDGDGRLDGAAAARLARWCVAHGSDGLVVAGSTGEAATLSDREREDLFRAVRNAVPATVPVYVGTGTNDTARTVALSRQARDYGADGLLLVTPYYNKPTQTGLERHFLAVAEAVALPIMLYNVPSRTGVTLEAETVARVMAQAPRVMAVKEAGGSLDAYTRLLRTVPADRYVLSGDDSLTLPAMAVGAYGVVSVAAHLVGDEMRAMIEAFRAGEVERAAALHRTLFPVFRELFSLPNPVPLKWALNWLGLGVGEPRLPLVAATDDDLSGLRGALVALGRTPGSARG